MVPRKPLVVFDMDGVLIEERSSWRLVHDALGTSNEDSFKAYMRAEIDDLEFMRRDIELWLRKGITSISQVEGILQGATMMRGVSECVRPLRRWGAVLAIVSGGLDLLAERLGKEWGFSYVAANGLAADQEGIHACRPKRSVCRAATGCLGAEGRRIPTGRTLGGKA